MSDEPKVILCLSQADRQKLVFALANAPVSIGPADGCITDFVSVRIDLAMARVLLSTLAVALEGVTGQ